MLCVWSTLPTPVVGSLLQPLDRGRRLVSPPGLVIQVMSLHGHQPTWLCHSYPTGRRFSIGSQRWSTSRSCVTILRARLPLLVTIPAAASLCRLPCMTALLPDVVSKLPPRICCLLMKTARTLMEDILPLLHLHPMPPLQLRLVRHLRLLLALRLRLALRLLLLHHLDHALRQRLSLMLHLVRPMHL